MPKFYDTKEFKEINDKWKQKLKKSGFQDIEQDEERLKKWDSTFFVVNYNKTLYAAKETYYRYANQFVHDHMFNSKLDKNIWEKHARGLSMQDITDSLKNNKATATMDKVCTTIQKLSKLMKQRYKLSGVEDNGKSNK